MSAPGTPPAPAPAAAPAPAPAGGGAATLLMGGSVAVAALGAGAAYIATALRGFALWQIILGIVAAILVLLSPLMLLAVLKLRKRDVSAILEGSGWAINARMRLTRQQCALFTQKPKYPKDAEGVRGWGWWIAAGVAVCVLIMLLSVGWYYLSTSPLRRALPSSASEVVDRYSDVRPDYTYYLKARMSEADFRRYCDTLGAKPCVAGGKDLDNTIPLSYWSVSPSTDNAFVVQSGRVTTYLKRDKDCVYVKSIAR
jgi:hypothetical protein